MSYAINKDLIHGKNLNAGSCYEGYYVLVLRCNLLGIVIYDVKYANSVLIKFRCAYL